MSREELLSVSERLVERALREGFDEAAVLVMSNGRSMVKIANSEPSIVQYWRTINVSLYLARNKRVFIVEFETPGLEEVDKSIKELLGLSSKIVESPLYAPLPEPGKPEPIEGIVDKKIIEKLDDPSDIAELVIEASHRERINYIAGTIDLVYREKALSTSRNASFYEDSTMLKTYIRAFAEPDGSGQWSIGSTRLDLKGVEEAAIIASRYAVDSRNRIDIEPGVYDLVLSPMVFGNLVNYIGRMSSAFSILMGLSIFMRNKPGDKVASEKFTLIDDPRSPELPGSTSFDDEGVATYTKPIIEAGVLKNILHNSKTAARMNTRSTGNAGWVYPQPWNLIVEPGDYSFEELIGEVKRGILITNNWYTRLQNYVEGIFSTITRDALFLIENGRITKPVKKIRIADRLPRLLNNIDALGERQYSISWWEVTIPTRLPYILTRQIHTSKHTI